MVHVAIPRIITSIILYFCGSLLTVIVYSCRVKSIKSHWRVTILFLIQPQVSVMRLQWQTFMLLGLFQYITHEFGLFLISFSMLLLTLVNLIVRNSLKIKILRRAMLITTSIEFSYFLVFLSERMKFGLVIILHTSITQR